MSTNPTNLPPLPDWLDVEAGGIEDEQLQTAALLIAGLRRVGRNNSGSTSPHIIVPPFDASRSPHACIARWAAKDGERWADIEDEIRSRTDYSGVVPRSPMFDGPGSLYAGFTATDAQLYRALVNVAWDEWREEYNKRREAAEVTE